MNTEIIKVNYDSERPTVLGRELHAALQISTPYHKWFPRMCEYGFVEDTDFWTNLSESTGGRPGAEHLLSIDMAKEVCMIQRTDIGKQCRQYFLELEKAWNSPETVMARALQVANRQLINLRDYNQKLEGTVAVQRQQIS